MELAQYVEKQLGSSKNLATEAELLEQVRVAYNAFICADVSGCAELAFQELTRLCESLGLPMDKDEEDFLVKMDTNGSGTLDLDEWLSWWLKRVGSSPNPAKQAESLARHTFKRFDADNSGMMDSKELRLLFAELGASFSDKEMAEALKELDGDGSGQVDEQEFADWWTNRSLNKRKGGGLIALKLRKLANKAQQLFSTDIFTASWTGDAELVKLFVDGDSRMSGASDVSEFGDGWTPLHLASYRGHTKIVQCLLDACSSDGARASLVNKTTDKGFTALFYAAQTNQLDLCRLLLEAAADPTISGTSDEFSDVTVSLCPADLCIDSAELGELLRGHDKCMPPECISADLIEASLSGTTGLLSIDLVNSNSSWLRSISALPIRRWRVELECSSSSLARPLSMKIPASSQAQGPISISAQVTKAWHRQLMQDLDDDAEPIFTVQLAPVNALLDEGPLSDPVTVVYVPSAARKKETESVKGEN